MISAALLLRFDKASTTHTVNASNGKQRTSTNGKGYYVECEYSLCLGL